MIISNADLSPARTATNNKPINEPSLKLSRVKLSICATNTIKKPVAKETPEDIK